MNPSCPREICAHTELIWKKGVPSEHKICPNCEETFRIFRCSKCGKEFDVEEKYKLVKYIEGAKFHEGCKISLLAGDEYDVKYTMRVGSSLIGDGVRDEWTGQIVQKVSRKDTKELVYKSTL